MMFFDEEDLGQLKKKAVLRLPPPVPDTGWRPPQYFPNLSGAAAIAIDTETKETDFDHGPGWGRGAGHIVGFSVATVDRAGNTGSWYFPVRHEFEPEWNLDPKTCFNWLREQLHTPHIPKIGANLIYDIGWLTTENIFVQGELHDVQFAEALLNEDGFVNLEYLGQKYLKTGKDSSAMYQWLADAYGGNVNSDQRGNIYRAPPRLVGSYAESDALLPLQIINKQWVTLAHEELLDIYRMECDTIPLLVRMRLRGVNIDIKAAERLYGELAHDITRLESELYAHSGIRGNVNSPGDLAKIFDHFNIPYPKTKAGNPSFRKEFLQGIDHPIAELIRSTREHIKIRNTFIKAYLLERNNNGIVHCSFHPLRGDDDGTRSGRYSSSDPNLQNIPIRTKLGNRVRKLFIPHVGHSHWEKDDYSQIEYRDLAHFAVGPGSDALRAEYNSNPKTDYHNNTHYRLCPFMGWDINDKEIMNLYRRPIKNINFGLLYGMGKAKLARALTEYFKGKLSKAEIDNLFRAYHEANPYVKATMEAAANEVHLHGYVKTVLGRRSRFNMWEPKDINYQERARALPYEQALRNYGVNIQRSATHKAINRKLQGSAADQIKKGMHKCFKDGVFDVIGVPLLQVHDELDFSVIDDSPIQQEAYRYMRHTLETALPLRVPVLVDFKRGENWGALD